MNNQFFGDERDFFKYALLRILAACGLPIGVCWLLTGGCRKGGGELAYLRDGKLRDMDAGLFDFLRDHVCVKGIRNVQILEKARMIPDAIFFSNVFPLGTDKRMRFFEELFSQFSERQLVFFDPDTGICPSNPGNSADEYVRWDELRLVGERLPDSSIMVFQYFRMPWDNKQTKKRRAEISAELRRIGGERSAVFALWRRPIAYYFVIRPEHERRLLKGVCRACRILGFEKCDTIGG